ncbi:MAG: T9SS type A sorting domain-containing protein [Flavobacteriales bacterium]|nr:MAG: T9SS type A sorting domain-containing protein [Flavobacteriales bacterium]
MRTLNKLLACTMALVVPLCTWAQTETEPNNSAGTANALSYNTAMVGSSGACAPTDVSVDWYSITSTAQGVLRLQTSMSNTGGSDVPVSVQLRNSSQTVIATFAATAGANGVAVDETFTHLCSGIGVYYISIANPSPSVCTNYSLTYDRLAPDYANDSEPNGNAGQTLDTLDAGVPRDGQINFQYGDADDWHRILAPNDGVITVTVLAEHADAAPGTMNLRLRNSSSTVLQTWTVNVGASGTPMTNTFTRNCTGAEVHYFLTFDGPSVCGASYRISYTVAAPFYGDDAEPNQSAGPAIIADAGTNYDGRLSFEYDNTIDWFRLQAPNDGLMTVTVLAEHAGALPSEMTVYLRDNASSVIETWTAVIGASGVPVSNTFTHTCSGTEEVYYLSLDTPDDCGVSYRFNYTVAAPLYADDLEPNQSAGPAIIANAGADYDGRVTFEYDNASDWYRLQAPNDGVITVTVLAENAGPTAGTMNVLFRNSSSTVLETWTANVGANGSPATTTFTRNCTGTEAVYYLDLRDPTICGASYRFNYTVAAPVFNDDAEPNESAGPAIVANAGTNYEGRVTFDYDNASDWYRLQAPNDGVITVTVLAENAGPTAGTMNVLFRNSSSTVLETWTANVDANGSPATTTFTRNCTGTEAVYYLDLRDPNVCGVSYRFNYTVAAPLYADDAEPNQNAGAAIPIDLNAAPAFGRASFEYDNSSDWFEVNHPGGVLTVNVRAENAGATGVMTLRIRNSSSTVLVTNATAAVGGGGVGASSSVATAGSVAAGTYYVEVESPTVCGVSYRLDCYDDDNDGVCNSGDLCAGTPNGEGVNSNGCSCSQVVIDDGDVCTLDECLNGNVTNTFQDADGDLTCDANDGCPNDPNKIAPGECGCGVADTDTDGDLTADCNDGCPNDPNKIAPGICGCGVSDVDTDGDLTADCNDGCPADPNKIAPGACGCGVADTDTDSDGTADCNDACPNLANLVNGDPCDDGNPNTINDVVSNCICAGTLLGNDCEGVPGGPAVPGTACNDNDDCTTGDVYDANCICAGTFADADADGTCDANDLCPGGPEPGTVCDDLDACTTGDVIGTNCLCAGTFADADNDGTCDADDLCPGGPEPGTTCDDLNANTINDVIGTNCLCAGTLLGNDCEGVPGGPAVPGTACNDNDDCTTGDVYDANCLCAGTFADADNDGTCDADDLCPGGPEPGTACDDLDACTTGDVIGTNCLCAGTFADADNDGTCDADDLCPGGPEPGTVCDDLDPNTTGDVIGTNCLCAGVNVNCTEDLVMSIALDAFGSQTTWEITDALTSTVVASGGPYSDGTPGAIVSTNICLPAACYNLVVSDAMGDGIAAGGYVLTDDLGRRIIDASGDFGPESSVTISGGDFCVPLGPTFVKPNWCDRTDLVPSSFIYCQGVAGASGYQFWFFDPHGSYSRRILRPATDCRLSNLQTNPAPFGLPLNVCVRPLVNGNYLPFGKVCRIMVNNPGGNFRDLSTFSTDGPHLSLYPNPVKDDLVFIRIEGLGTDIEAADITVHDATGKSVITARVPLADGTLNHVLEFGSSLGEGLYLVQVRTGTEVFTQRLVVH